MSYDIALHVIISCDRCLVPALTNHGDPQCWPSLAAATTDLTHRTPAWKMTARQHWCPRCAAAERCHTEGHRWGTWRSMAALGAADLQIHFCRRCNTDEVATLTPAEEPS